MSNKKKAPAAVPATDPDPAPQLLSYEVMVPSVKIGRIIAYRTARLSLTQEQANALNSAQPDTVKFLGI